MKLKEKGGLFLVITLILVGIISRILPHPPNVTPLTAIALLGAAKINKKYIALFIPIVIMFFSDFIMNNTFNRMYFDQAEGLILWAPFMTWVYLAFILIAGLGIMMLKKVDTTRLILSSITCSIIFFLLSNVGIWLGSPLYPQSAVGFVECLTAALPFFRNTLLGDLFFVAVIFGAYYFIENKVQFFNKVEV